MTILSGLAALFIAIALSSLVALSEISFAAAREPRLRSQAEQGDARAKAFLRLRRNSGQVMTVLQIAFNAISVFGGIISSDLLTPGLTRNLIAMGMGTTSAEHVAAISAFILVTGLFVLFADLIPKRIAIAKPNDVALHIAWFLTSILKLCYPAVIVFSKASDLLLKLLRIPAAAYVETLTPEDLNAVLAAGTASGALLQQEHQLIQNVLRLQDRAITSAMTPRDDIVFLDIHESLEAQRNKVRARPYSRYPLCEGGLDHIIGSIRAEDVLVAVVEEPGRVADCAHTPETHIYRLRRDVLSLPDTLNLWDTLAQFDSHGAGFALIANEYGLVVGLITFKDIMGALIDGLASPFDEQMIVRRDEHSWLVDGSAPIEDVIRDLKIVELGADPDLFHTIGGFVMHRLRRIARKADFVEAAGFRFEVVNVDHFRINQLLISRITQKAKSTPDR